MLPRGALLVVFLQLLLVVVAQEALPMELYFSAAELSRIAGYGEDPVSSVSVSGQVTCELCARPGADLLAFELPGPAAAASSDPSSYAVQARKLLNITATAMRTGTAGEPSSRRTGGGGGGVRSSYSAELIMGPDDCSKEDVSVSQQNTPPLPNGIPTYSVDIINTCEECNVSDIHIACGEFASTELVDPAKFQRVAINDCVVKGGAALEPSESVSFQYSNSFSYPLTVVSVSCP